MKQAIVLGGSKSGNAVVKLLLDQGYSIIWADDGPITIDSSIDQSKITLYEEGIPMSLGELKTDLVVKNPAIPDTHPVVTYLADRYFIYTESDIAFLYSKNFHYAAITGTNGKTTTTALLDHLLEGGDRPHQACGNIGLPLSEVAHRWQQQPSNIALELSSFQIDGLLFFKPQVATILNLAPDHLDRYFYLENYYHSKFRLLQNMDQNDIFLRNIDDEEIVKRTHYLKCQIIDFSIQKKADVYLEANRVYYKEQFLFNVDDLPIQGPHNLQNAMVATMMALILGVPLPAVVQQLKTFEPIKHRLQPVKTINHRLFVNDSKATNPEATMVALASYRQPVILLLGGYDKQLGFDQLIPYRDQLKEVILFGQTKFQLAEIFPQGHLVGNLEEAVLKAVKLSAEGDVILLSPACASFDQYQSFEERGDHFIHLVEAIEQID